LPEPSPIEQYLSTIDSFARHPATHQRITPDDVRPPLWILSYPNEPQEGWRASFSYGLSSVDHPLWRLGKPELMICVNTVDDAWGLAVGFLAMQHRGAVAFAYGSTFELGHRVSADSAMTAFLAFAPMDLPKGATRIKLSDRTLNLVQMYPIYADEIEVIQQAGPEAFLTRSTVDFHDIARPNLALA
jgi:hypothetical protein